DAWLAREGVAREAISALDRLAYMGQRGMGALEFKPTHGPKKRKPSVLKVSDLVSASRRALNERLDLEHAEAAIMQLIQVGTSAGGARAKAVVAWNPKTDEIRSGQLPAETGFEHWLLKIDGVGPDHELGEGGRYGRIEYAYHLMARAAGIDMADCRLFEEAGRAHFMTRRFDRPGGEKLHVQSL
ncbi:MAG: HipA domain-containing protein, partial [Flavobacteriales bacterium]|nr:HipA domain-containing protein [Flavobacteriales bacterium]